MRGLAVILLGVFASSAAAQQAAQTFRGIVRDSASGLPVLGAVVIARDSAGITLARTITSDQGRYQIIAARRARDLQLFRIGFRPREIALPRSTRDVVELTISLEQIPTLLEPVRTRASSRCRARSDATLASGVLSQARAALLASIVAREANPASVTLVRFDRIMAGLSDSIDRQKVRLVSDEGATMSFNATHTALDFVRDGFMRDSSGHRTWYGPDAEVLLDDGFASGYCFSIASGDSTRRDQIGVSFAPAARRDGRIDIEGSLWIDTVARSLKDVEFRYLGLDNITDALRPGGRVSFREMKNGVVLIDQWSLRMIGSADSLRRGVRIQEVGGELAHARWPDGREWTAPLGTLHVAVVDHRGARVSGTVIGLDSTDYRSVTDSAGVAVIEHLVPGPYTVMVVDPELAALGIRLRTRLEFVAARDSTVRLALDAPTIADFLSDLCRAGGVASSGPWLLGRVTTLDGQGIGGVRWRMAKSSVDGWRPVADGGKTGTSGLFHFCRGIALGETIQIQAWREGEQPAVLTKRVDGPAMIVGMQLSSALAGVAAPGAAGGRVFAGLVLDSATRRPVSGAHVSLVGTPIATLSDSAGRFIVTGLRPGRYRAELRTWSLDSLGVVSQSYVTLDDPRAPVTLYLPTRTQIAATLCANDSVTRSSGTGAVAPAVVAGHVEVRGDSLPPLGVPVIATWTDAATRKNRSLRSETDSRGVFRVCGVPRDVDLAVRASADVAAGETVTVRVPPDDDVAIVDLSLGRIVALPSVVTTEKVTIPSFEENRRLGVGRFLTRADLEKRENQRLSEALAQVAGLGAVRNQGGHGYVMSTHVTPRLPKLRRGCGQTPANACGFTTEDLAEQGIYCPTGGESRTGVVCGCYSQIYLDRQLMNPGSPTEPWDINTIPTQELEAVEYYPSPAQTPTEYSRRDAKCGVVVLWTRRERSPRGS